MIPASAVKKYINKPLPWLLKKATEKFNTYIRARDAGQTCISCGSNNACQATHFYSAGQFPELRFHEDNVHLGCIQCNYFKHGNLLPYRHRLIQKIGMERVEKLDLIVAMTRQTGFKWDKLAVIEILLKYK